MKCKLDEKTIKDIINIIASEVYEDFDPHDSSIERELEYEDYLISYRAVYNANETWGCCPDESYYECNILWIEADITDESGDIICQINEDKNL